MIFDEIDVGVSGRVSQAIAEKLHQLSQDHQLLCVTHQPLIAAMADRHFRVRKEVLDQDRTVIHVETLGDQAARTRELAELAGGESAQEALSFAQSLLSQAADRRQGHGAPASGHSSSGHSETHAGTTHSSLDPSLDPTPTTPTPEPDLEETPKTKTKTKKNTAQRKTAPRGKTTARKKRTTRTAKTKQET
jgi:DNA repair protein RecN (Recombination protein N)